MHLYMNKYTVVWYHRIISGLYNCRPDVGSNNTCFLYYSFQVSRPIHVSDNFLLLLHTF